MNNIFFSMLFRLMYFLHIPQKYAEQLVQFIEFCMVGISNTFISYVVYLVLVILDIHYLFAGIIGFIASVINAFYWNNKYVFARDNTESKPSLIYTFVKTFLSYAATGLVLSNALLVLWIEVIHIPHWLAPIISLFITIPLNFILSKFWTFNSRK